MAIEPSGKIDPLIRIESPSPTDFFESAYRVFREAEQTAGVSIDRFYSIGNHRVRLRFAGPALIPAFTQAIEHLAAEPLLNPDLTVCIWDDVSSQTRMPPPPWAGYAVYSPNGEAQGIYTRRGEVRGFNNDRICTAYNWSAAALSMLDKRNDLALYWTHDVRRLPSYETSAPLRTILHWWMNQHGRQFVHSGAVGTPRGGVLLAGKGGTGKSTTALSCLNSDMQYVSDDYCLIATDPVPYAYSIYSSAKINADNIQRVPHLMPTISNHNRVDKEKAVFFLYPYFANKIATGFPIRGILVPRISGKPETRVIPASPVEVLKALALSTMSQLAGAGKESLQIMHRLVHQLPCYHIELGTDLTRIPDIIAGLLR